MVVFGPNRDIKELFWVAGQFNYVNGQPLSENPRGNLYPTLSDGSPFGSSDNKQFARYNNTVFSLCLDRPSVNSATQVLVGGGFTNFNGNTALDYLVRISTIDDSGNYDSNFTPQPNDTVLAIAVQNLDYILVGGAFTTLSGNTSPYFGRIRQTDGSKDLTWNAIGFNGSVSVIILQDDGKILVGGGFTDFSGTSTINMTGIIRLNSDGDYDTTFNSGYTGFDGAVNDIQLQPDGKILVGGSFSSYNDSNGTNYMNFFCRLNTDGSFDTTFNPSGTGPDAEVSTIALDRYDRIYAGGKFTTYTDAYSSNTANYMVRVNSDGTYDSTFDTTQGFDNFVNSIVNSFDNLFVGGRFQDFNGVGVRYAARINYDATADISYISNIYEYDSGGGPGAPTISKVLYQRTYL